MKYIFKFFLISLMICSDAFALFYVKLLQPVSFNQSSIVKGDLKLHDQIYMLQGKIRSMYMQELQHYIVQVLWEHRWVDNQWLGLSDPILSTFKTPNASLAEGMLIPVMLDETLLESVVGQLEKAVSDYRTEKTPSSNLRSVIDTVNNLPWDKRALEAIDNQSLDFGSPSYIGSANTVQQSPPYYPNNWHAEHGSIDPMVTWLHQQMAESKQFIANKREKKSKSKKRGSISQIKWIQKMTSEGCEPRLDWANSRVIMQHKVMDYENDKLIKESVCQDSMEYYPIQKDYDCADCSNDLDWDAYKAYPKFLYYWVDKTGQRIDISNHPVIDQKKSFSITDKIADCKPKISIKNRTAKVQVKSVYTNQTHTEVTARDCHVPDNPRVIAIELTDSQCVPTHDFEHRWSILKKRGVYQWQDKMFKAIDCFEVGHPIVHQFDTKCCLPDIDYLNNRAIIMGKRFIEYEGKKVYIRSQCEPIGQNQTLMATTEGCADQYVHDYEQQKSYPKQRWFYRLNNKRVFVTQCLAGDRAIAHQYELIAYQHHDIKKESIPIYAVYINGAHGRISLNSYYKTSDVPAIPYRIVSEKDIATGEFYYQECKKMIATKHMTTYQRADNTLYQAMEGPGQPIAGGNECVYTQEIRQVHDHTLVFSKEKDEMIQKISVARFKQSKLGDGIDDSMQSSKPHQKKHLNIYRIEQRTKITYPDGTCKYSPWQPLGTGVIDT